MKKYAILFFTLSALPMMCLGCAHRQKPLPVEPPVFSWIQPTNPNTNITGKASFWPAGDAVKIRIVITNAKPGLHGVHVHENGDCGDAGNLAGGHFNPDHVPHGDVLKSGFKHAHPGDLGNVSVDSTGLGFLEVTIPRLTLDKGPYGIVNRSIIIHEKADDFGQPTGNAGAREACAIIPNPLKCDC